MKVAIIGGGFYGIMASLEVAKNDYVKEVDLFEKGRSLINAAGKFNQARLHLGFHYPRSQETILQSKSGFNLYKERFPNVTKSIKKNVYLIREDGLTGIDEYLMTMRRNKLNFQNIDISETSFKYKFDGCPFQAIRVNERYIDIVKLNQSLIREINEMGINVCLNQKVKTIDSEKGIIELNNGFLDNYDFIINCTYTNPFLGFSNNPCSLKYEFCTLLLISSEEIKDQAITVMDGPFVSIYPWLSNLHSVSSVKFTPSIKTNNFPVLQNLISKRTIEQREETLISIEDHMKSFFGFNYTLVGDFSTFKVKLKNDQGDQRLVKTFCEGKCITVLQGKLDAVDYFLSDVICRLNELK